MMMLETSLPALTMSSAEAELLDRQTRTRPSQCRICGAPALYSYFGTVVCQSCKMFFKRNGERGQALLRCDLEDQCEITENNRRTCSACRLAKCLTAGMRTEMIRSTRSKKTKTSANRHQQQVIHYVSPATPTDLVRANRTLPPVVSPLKADYSILSNDQWHLLSNLIHCYDEYNGYSYAARFISEQNVLPIKIRFKSTPVSEFIAIGLNQAQTLFEKNHDFLALCAHDRTQLLRTTASHVAGLSVHIILTRAQLMDHPAFLKTHEILFGPTITGLARRLDQQVDGDTVVVKLLLAILSFSTTTYSVYSDASAVNFVDMKSILQIQDTYTELLWQYLHYRYDAEQVVYRFLGLVRCILSVQEAIVQATDVRWFTDVMDTLVESTEHSLSLVE